MITRLNPREKIMLGIIGAALAVLLSMVLLRFFLGKNAELNAQLAATRSKVEILRKRESERELWEKRDQWLNTKMPRLGDADVANKALRESILAIAKTHTVTLEAPAPGVPATQPSHISLSVRLEAKSPWQAMFNFLYDLQGPEKFVAIESCELKMNREDKTQLRASLSVAQWFATK
jgi:lipid A disaccharide synthetase